MSHNIYNATFFCHKNLTKNQTPKKSLFKNPNKRKVPILLKKRLRKELVIIRPVDNPKLRLIYFGDNPVDNLWITC